MFSLLSVLSASGEGRACLVPGPFRGVGVCISGTMSLLVVCLGGWICLGGWVESMSGVGMSSGLYVGWGYVQGVGPGRGWVLTPPEVQPQN